MPEPLKNLYSKTLIKNLCREITLHYSNFDTAVFSQLVFDQHWPHKALKQRMRHITECLHQQLPQDYMTTINILKPVSSKFTGFEYMFFQDYVECYGLHDFDTSIAALKHFTRFASSEFAVRVFILQDEQRMMKQMQRWAKSDNFHLRRLASEGCRPRLPWAISLPAFKKNPQAVLSVIKHLMQDESDYVRRSVANNLNDISKDHPQVVIDWAKRYLGKNKNTDQLIKHASRTLLKQGNKTTLTLFGYTDPGHMQLTQFHLPDSINMGGQLPFSFILSSKQKQLGKCRIEFSIDFVKANNRRNRKIFKISEGNYATRMKQVNKTFSFKKISTRTYYVGEHCLSIFVNGVEQATKTFQLTL